MKKLLLVLIVFFFSKKEAHSQVIYQDDFESYPNGAYNNALAYNSGTGHGWWQVQNAATSLLIFPGSGCPSITPDQHKIVNTGAYQGSQCARVFYNTNELWSGSSTSTGCRWRAEFAERLGNDGLATSGPVEVWYGFMVKPMKTNGLQWTKRCMGTTGNDVSCVGLRDNLSTHVSQFVADESGSTAILVDIHEDIIDQASARYFDITNIGRTQDVVWDQWNSIVMHVITGTGGIVEAWVNGVYYTSGTINLWTATWTHDFKIGIYGDRVDQQAEAYFDNVKFAKGANQFSAVNPIISNDTQAPTTPSNLTSSGVTSVSANLSWTASTDNVGVTGYDIYQNGAFAKNVAGTSTTMTGLTPATAYSFYVKAKDAAGNASAASNTVNITTTSATNLLPNGNVESGLTDWSGNSATVSVTSSGVHGGTKALSVTGRSQNWACGQYDITSILAANGQGNYAASIWMKMASGTMAGVLQIKVIAGGVSQQFGLQSATVGTSWMQLSGTANLTWTGTLTAAYIFVDGNNKRSYFFDDASLKLGTSPRPASQTGNVENLLISPVSVFPNPASNAIQIAFSQNWNNKKISVKLFNDLGQSVMMKTIEKSLNKETIDFNNKLVNGLYILKLENLTDNKVEFKKVQVKR